MEKYLPCVLFILVSSAEPSLDESTDDDSGFENDEEYYKNDEDYQSDNNINKTSAKSNHVEIELPKKLESTSSKPALATTTTTTTTAPTTRTTAKTSQIEATTPSTVKSTTVRMPAVRSETVPNGFRGKADGKVKKTTDNVDDRPDSFVTVTKSVSGSLDNAKTPAAEDKKFESTYYTKSSTCGYFTFTCNVVYGSNGRSKICRPKAPSNGKC